MPETPDYIYHEPSLPPWLDDLLKSCPPDSDGTRARHRWILECANGLRYYVPANKAAELIRQHLTRRPKDRKEISEAVAKAYGANPPDSAPTPSPITNPDLDCLDQVITDYVASGETLRPLDKLKSLSGPIPTTTDEVLLQLFPAGTLLCVAVDVRAALVGELGPIDHFERFPWLVPNPALGEYWTDPEGKQHPRSKHNFKERFYLVTDFDIAPRAPYVELISKWQARGLTPFDIQAAVILAFKKTCPLRLVVSSGNKSLHAWWQARGESESKRSPMRRFFENAQALGADRAGWQINQFFRMPGAIRIRHRATPKGTVLVPRTSQPIRMRTQPLIDST